MTAIPLSPKKTPLLVLHAATLIAFMAASGVPTPLYPLYQQQWSFSPLLLTVIFSAYAISLLLSLLVFGTLSDVVGRRPPILAAIALEAAAMLLFMAAQGPVWLIAARILQGFATGIATATLGATLLDVDRERAALVNSFAPPVGLGLGILASSLLVHWNVWPTTAPYAALAALFAVQLGLTALSPETDAVPTHAVWSPKPTIRIPPAARAAFMAMMPINVALWAFGGFYLSLMPSLVVATMPQAGAWGGGIAAAVLAAAGTLGIVLFRKRGALAGLVTGSLSLMIGPAVVLAGAEAASPALLMAGSVFAGIGWGAAYLGAVRSITPLAAPQERGGLMAPSISSAIWPTPCPPWRPEVWPVRWACPPRPTDSARRSSPLPPSPSFWRCPGSGRRAWPTEPPRPLPLAKNRRRRHHDGEAPSDGASPDRSAMTTSPPFDAAIVLGAMVRPDGSPSPALARRVARGVELVRSGWTANLLMSGGAVRHATPEAHVMRDLALAAGIAAERVHVEADSVNTIGNALHSRPLAEERGWSRLLVVTDACHMARSLYVFHRLGLPVRPAAAWPQTAPRAEWYMAWLREAFALPWTVIRVERLKLRNFA